MPVKADDIRMPALFNWERFEALAPHAVIYIDAVNLNGIAFQSGFYLKVVQAFGSGPFRVIVNTMADILDQWPDNFIINEAAPVMDIIAQADVFISNGDYLSICEALLSGLPTITLPLTIPQQQAADWIVSQGVGLKLNFNRFKANHLENAALEVLNNIDFKKNAERTGKLFVAPIGVQQAAGLLEQLCNIKQQREPDFKSNEKLKVVKQAN